MLHAQIFSSFLAKRLSITAIITQQNKLHAREEKERQKDLIIFNCNDIPIYMKYLKQML